MEMNKNIVEFKKQIEKLYDDVLDAKTEEEVRALIKVLDKAFFDTYKALSSEEVFDLAAAAQMFSLMQEANIFFENKIIDINTSCYRKTQISSKEKRDLFRSISFEDMLDYLDKRVVHITATNFWGVIIYSRWWKFDKDKILRIRFANPTKTFINLSDSLADKLEEYLETYKFSRKVSKKFTTKEEATRYLIKLASDYILFTSKSNETFSFTRRRSYDPTNLLKIDIYDKDAFTKDKSHKREVIEEKLARVEKELEEATKRRDFLRVKLDRLKFHNYVVKESQKELK